MINYRNSLEVPNYCLQLIHAKAKLLALGFRNIESLFLEFFPEWNHPKKIDHFNQVITYQKQSQDIVYKLNQIYTLLKNE